MKCPRPGANPPCRGPASQPPGRGVNPADRARNPAPKATRPGQQANPLPPPPTSPMGDPAQIQDPERSPTLEEAKRETNAAEPLTTPARRPQRPSTPPRPKSHPRPNSRDTTPHTGDPHPGPRRHTQYGSIITFKSIRFICLKDHPIPSVPCRSYSSHFLHLFSKSSPFILK